MPNLNFTLPPHEQPGLQMDVQPAAASASDEVAKKPRRVIIMLCSFFEMPELYRISPPKSRWQRLPAHL
jgi:hypothetical protein